MSLNKITKQNKMKTKIENSKIVPVLKRAREAASRNDMLGTAIEVSHLYDMGIPIKEIPNRLKKVGCQVSLPHVYNHIKLAGVPAKVKAHIKSDRIQPTEVLKLMHKHQTDSELIELVDKEVAQREQKLNVQNKSKLQTQIDRFKSRMSKELKRAGVEPNENVLNKFIQNNFA